MAVKKSVCKLDTISKDYSFKLIKIVTYLTLNKLTIINFFVNFG